jgi:adenine-specific DNA glycosylase
MEERLPELAARPPSVPVVMGAAMVQERRKLLLFRRTRTRLLKDLWEPPLGQCAPGEDPRGAIVREARASYGIELRAEDELLKVKHTIMNRRITLHAYSAVLESRPSRGLESEYRWVSRDRVSELPLSSMVRKLIDRTG